MSRDDSDFSLVQFVKCWKQTRYLEENDEFNFQHLEFEEPMWHASWIDSLIYWSGNSSVANLWVLIRLPLCGGLMRVLRLSLENLWHWLFLRRMLQLDFVLEDRGIGEWDEHRNQGRTKIHRGKYNQLATYAAIQSRKIRTENNPMTLAAW